MSKNQLLYLSVIQFDNVKRKLIMYAVCLMYEERSEEKGESEIDNPNRGKF